MTIPSIDLSNDSTKLLVYSQSTQGNEEIVFEEQFYFHWINKSENSIIRSSDGLLSLSVPKSASKQNVYLTMNSTNFHQFSVSLPSDSLSPLFEVGPTDVPFFRPLTLAIKIPHKIHMLQQIGIYSPNIQSKKWNFISNLYNSKDSEIYAKIRSLGQFTLIRDITPPWFRFVTPKNGAVVSNRRPEIKVRFEDDLSNIGGEEDYRLTLDGNFCISEYDPELHLIKFRPDEPLIQGNHQLKFWIQDRAGNQAQKSISFIIQGAQ
jgi:hypothetical protein